MKVEKRMILFLIVLAVIMAAVVYTVTRRAYRDNPEAAQGLEISSPADTTSNPEMAPTDASPTTTLPPANQ